MPAEADAVYVHAPFCARRCVYCHFAVQVRRSGDVGAWVAALRGELTALRREGLLVPASRLRTLYVGGGTPSLLGPRAMAELRALLGDQRLAEVEEWTAEANPESVDRELACAWREAGVDRLSLGVQSFHAAALRWMGRLHGADGADRAVESARRAGIDNLSVDLIFALPDEVERPWREDLERTLRLGVSHVSLYGLSLEEGTPARRAAEAGRLTPCSEERYAEEYLLAAEVLASEGYRHYEVSNFARPGREARHNARYWEGGPYLGLGNGAHSFVPPVRRWNVREWEDYRTRAVRAEVPVEERETLDEEALRLERVWLSLRTAQGLALAPGDRAARALAAAWTRRGLAEVEEARVRLTPRGWLLLDGLAVEMDGALGA